MLYEEWELTKFVVACHNYESELNGMGRTLLVRRDPYKMEQWGIEDTYEGSNIDYQLNSNYPTAMRDGFSIAMRTTKIRVRDTVIARSAFLLSVAEYSPTGASTTDYEYYEEGSELPGIWAARWSGDLMTRTQDKNTRGMMYMLDGSAAEVRSRSVQTAYQPAFTLPETVPVAYEGMLFITGIEPDGSWK